MKNSQLLIAFYLFSALSLSCRAQAPDPDIVENLSPQGNAGSSATGSRRQQCPIVGSVASAVTGAPLDTATVRLRGLTADLGSEEVATDSTGHFQMLVYGGRYSMSVTREGYAQQTVAVGSAKGVSTLSVACSGDATGVLFLMMPEGIITGSITDEDDEPVANARVEAFHYRADPAVFSVAGSARSDDLGKYRISGISPGRYYVKVRAQNVPDAGAATPEKRQFSFVATYYPGTTHATAAAPLQVASGQETEADIPISKVLTVDVAGKLLTGYRIKNAIITAYPGDQPSWDLADRRRVEADDKTGKWIIRELQTGTYTLHVDSSEEGTRIGARQPVNVETKNMDDIILALARYPDLEGKVRVEGGSKLPPGMKVSLQPRHLASPMTCESVEPDSEGGFLLKATSPDLSDITVSNLPQGYFVKSITVADREVSATGVELALSGSYTADIVLSPNGATIEGTVLNGESKPCADTTVVLIPEAGRAGRRYLRTAYYTAKTAQNGRFTMSGIRPGAYTVAAWDSLDSFIYTDPQALEIVDKNGQTVKLEESSHSTMQLKPLASSCLAP